MRTITTSLGSAALLCFLSGCFLFPTNMPAMGVDPDEVFELAGERFRVETFATGLDVPWDMEFTPDGALLIVTERPGRLRALSTADGSVVATTTIDEVAPQIPRSEQGLMGLAISPTYADDQLVYVSYTIGNPVGTQNVIERLRFTGSAFERVDDAPLLEGLPADAIHDGFGLEFGPDGLLYASTGEAAEADRAQDPNDLGGKFLRINPDGSVPADNPTANSLVYTLGHRNPQGFDWMPSDNTILVGTEHGPSPLVDSARANDEVNIITAVQNYGWPEIFGDQTADGLVTPAWNSGSEPVAPSGAAFYTGAQFPAWEDAFLFATLRGASLFAATIDADTRTIPEVQRALQDRFGRLRAVAVDAEGYVYISTSNRDGRGTPSDLDDQILKLVPAE